MSSANRDNFTFFFSILIPFISLSCLTAVSRTFSTVLNRSGESGHPYLGPDLRGEAFYLSLLSTMLAVSLLYIAFIM